MCAAHKGWLLFLCFFMSQGVFADQMEKTLLFDDFSTYRPGMFSAGVIGAHAEYHYLDDLAPNGNWVVSAFRSDESQRAWRIIVADEDCIMYQSYYPSAGERAYTHPMIISGDSLWSDYHIEIAYTPESDRAQSGIVFRYRNDRCYYFFGLIGKEAVLKMVRHATGYHQPCEKILDRAPIEWKPGELLTARVWLWGERITARLNEGPQLQAVDGTFRRGKIGLTADVATRYSYVKVTTSEAEKQRLKKEASAYDQKLAKLQQQNPKIKLWRKIKTPRFGVGRNLRFGDLNGDGEVDILIGQMIHHGPKDRFSELSCLTAITTNGELLWQIGEPDAWKDHLTNDVAFQIHDIDGDGRNEVVYCMNFHIIVADGATGKTKYLEPTPMLTGDDDRVQRKSQRILGDCLFFCDLRGTGTDRDIIIKDRYKHLWALNDHLDLMWYDQCNTGHYPYAYDIDGDGKDEVMMGYTLFDNDGSVLWSLDGKIKDHADGVAILPLYPEKPGVLTLLCAASDEGIFFTDMEGNIHKHHYLGHVQNPAIANFRDDLPGLESVSINFWGNQGIIHYYNAEGEVYHDFEPCQHGSMCLPINWTGKSEEYFVLSANVTEGGLFDGRGRKVVTFPADGHPDLCNAVLDMTGDRRDEIVVWDPYEIWIYTQDDNPKQGRLYKPERNPLYNYSNYQASVSVPGWEE